MTKAAALYCRISDDRHGTGLGVARQEQDCRRLCDDRGWEVAELFVDNDISAYSGKSRPGYRRLLAALAAGEVNAVVAWHPDRLHRSPRELEDFIDLLERTKATVATVTAGEYDLSTPSGRLAARIVGAVARGESEHKSERIRRKHQQLAEQGRQSGGGTRAYGWHEDRKTIRPAEAELVREAATRVLAGETLRSVASDWNRREIATTTGGEWTTTVLRRCLTAWRTCGIRSLRDEPITRGQWEPILDRPTVERLRRHLLDPSRRTNSLVRRYLLTGMAFCSLCGAKLVARPRSDKRRCYVCATGPNFKGCGKIRVLADPLEQLIVEAVKVRLDSSDFADALARQAGGDAADEIADDLASDQEMLTDLAADLGDKRITRAEWLAARAPIERRIAAAEKQMHSRTDTDVLTGFLGASAALAAEWVDMPIGRRQAVVSTVVESVTVGPGIRGLNRFDPNRVDMKWRA